MAVCPHPALRQPVLALRLGLVLALFSGALLAFLALIL
jgi:hypothetical protein